MPITVTDDFLNSDESPIRAVAIVHCHFEPGGVTQVVQNHVNCLLRDTRVVLVSGPRTSGLRREVTDNVASLTIDSLEYDSLQPHGIQGGEPAAAVAGRTCATLDQELRKCGLDPSDSIIHWHNHSLGKNAAAPLVIAKLVQARWRLLLQIHDFAEDQRPANYRHLIDRLIPADSFDLPTISLDRILYPHNPQISYAVLTTGDADVLTGSGIAAARVHLIPNSVVLPKGDLNRTTAMQKISDSFGVDTRSRWLLYPVRGIRRKNVGEFLLWCQLLHRKNQFGEADRPHEAVHLYVGGVTLRPTTPVEAASYNRWKEVANEWVPNVVFDVGEHPDVSFIDNLAACHCVLSTSVAEGFGMAFLEPWLVDRRVVARDLPAVTSGFTRDGMRLTDLYASAWVPGTDDWIARMNERWRQRARQIWAGLPESMSPHAESHDESPEDSQRLTDRIDFARLLPADQIDVIRRVSADVAFARDLIALNQTVIEAIESDGDDANIVHNRKIIESQYQADVQRDQLHAGYRQSMSQSMPGHCGTNPGGDRQSGTHEVSTDSRCHTQNSSSVDPEFPVRVIDLVNRSHPFYPCRVESL